MAGKDKTKKYLGPRTGRHTAYKCEMQKEGRIAKYCAFCGKLLGYFPPSQAMRHVFCKGTDCRKQYNHSNGISGIEQICAWCGNTIGFFYRSQLRNHVYCSKECKQEAINYSRKHFTNRIIDNQKRLKYFWILRGEAKRANAIAI